MFKIPKLEVLIDAAKSCLDKYKEKRSEFDRQRFLGSVRPATKNQSRIDDAQFIVNLGEWLSYNKLSLTKELEHSDYNKKTVPFIKEALTGAFILKLMGVTAAYGSEESVFGSSALSQVIMNTFGIEKLSDVEKDTQNTCLSALKKLLTETTAIGFKMHPSQESAAIVAEIDAKLLTLEQSMTATI